MTNVDFIIIGAQKTGTTSLFEYLRRHPQIHMPAEKEIGFFNVERTYQRGVAWYVRTVTGGAAPGAVCGEASVGYMDGTPFGNITDNEDLDPNTKPTGPPLEDVVPSRIAQHLPAVKLICILRDPVARAFSHYQMAVLDQVEQRSFDDAVEELLEPGALERSRAWPTKNNRYIVNGEYARILAGYRRVFPAGQLKVVYSQELSARPGAVLADVFRYIGVADRFLPDNLTKRYRTASVKRRVPGLDLYAWQSTLARSASARRAWHSLPGKLRRSFDRTLRVASFRVEVWNAQRGNVNDEMSQSARRRLIAHYRPDSETLRDALGQEAPWLAEWGLP